MFNRMQQSSPKPDLSMLSMAFKECTMTKALHKGQVLHSQIVEVGVAPDSTLENAVMDLYGKCSRLEDAHKVFVDMKHRDLVSWNTLIDSHVKHGQSLLAINLFTQMCAGGIKPSEITYSCLLKACSKLQDACIGRCIHKSLINSGFELDPIVGNTLIDMYSKCGMVEEARRVFNCLQVKSIVSWGSLIAGFANQGCGLLAFDVFCDMLYEGIQPNGVILSCVLKTCGSSHLRSQGMFVNDLIIRLGFEFGDIIGNALLEMYIACGSIFDAENVFLKLPHKDDIVWNTLIAGYTRQGYHLLALEQFWKMQQAGVDLSKSLALCVIKASTMIGEMFYCRLLHVLLVETEQDSDVSMRNTLVDMYTKCGSLSDAKSVFDALQGRNLVSWSALISGYVAHRRDQCALDLVAEMQQEGIEPNDVIYLSILKVCANRGELEHGRLIHDQIIREVTGLSLLLSNMIIYMYATCGSLDEGRKLFDLLPVRDVVSWGVMLDGCVQNEDGYLALELFEKMQKEKVQPNKVILTLVLKSCGIIGSVEHGRLVHDLVIDSGIEAVAEIGTTVIDMYGSCGCLQEAQKWFNILPRHDVSSWNALIAGYSQHGYGKLALQCLQNMQAEGYQPDARTFTSVLAACSHEGQAENGCSAFSSIKTNHRVWPRNEHLNCVVDTLSRTGSLYDAEHLLYSVPQLPNDIGWLALLSSCKTFGSNKLGQSSFQEFGFRLDHMPDNNSRYA